jgi:hypothetical protein
MGKLFGVFFLDKLRNAFYTFTTDYTPPPPVVQKLHCNIKFDPLLGTRDLFLGT